MTWHKYLNSSWTQEGFGPSLTIQLPNVGIRPTQRFKTLRAHGLKGGGGVYLKPTKL